VRNAAIGEIARRAEPTISMILIGRGPQTGPELDFERKLFVIRKVMEREIRESQLPERRFFYVPSLSHRTLNYKGLLLADQVAQFFPDLTDERLVSGLALVHQRYSTNTFPTWDLAQPFRFLCHNGEINTLRGNINWLRAREAIFSSPHFGEDLRKVLPVATPGASDSAILDNAIELLYHTGRSLPHCMMMCIPEAWQMHPTMSDEKKAFYEYHACLMEPWDGPASIPFTDGKCAGAVLDRNGLRPSRYTVTRDGLVIMASETGVIEVPPENVVAKGRLQPGRMFLVDMEQGRIVDDEEIKHELATRQPYRKWLQGNLLDLKTQAPVPEAPRLETASLQTYQQLFGYTLEDLRIVLLPMGQEGKEPIGSMGSDLPLAVLSHRPQLVYNYFKQLFAQVTNPPLDAIREELVTSLDTTLGAEQNLFEETPLHCRRLRLANAVLTHSSMARLRAVDEEGLSSINLPMLYNVKEGGEGLRKGLEQLRKAAAEAATDGYTILVLTDRKANSDQAPIPALLAVSGVHHHLIRTGLRTRCSLVVESGEPREVHHFACLFGYGANAIFPYLALESLEGLIRAGELTEVDAYNAARNFRKGVLKGVLKVMSKMGISTLQSYRGAQIFECIGLNAELIEEYFAGTASRIGGIGLDGIAEENLARHRRAYPAARIPRSLDLEVGGVYQWRRNGEFHLFNPVTIAKLQQATRDGDQKVYAEYAQLINNQSRNLCTLRGLLEFEFDESRAIPLEEVEPWTAIVKRFKTGAMSYGSISKEAHETLAIAMNRIGGRSNSGEGGEDPSRFVKEANGDWRISKIKQVASGSFGVTNHYLVNAEELQIKMAQGAKPGEGGQLPGKKVYPWIAKTRHSTPYVGLISPPPHHDIYSIEDLAQLIHDLKNANHHARINVKLVAEVGVGTVAAGVSKGKADVVLISGWDGGTGASPQTALKHSGLPWELGLAETHQVLVENDLRSRITVECDGQLKTGRDVAIACLLGAEEFGFATAPLVTLGCIMMRVCHLDTCPVGVATQNPDLRKKFSGKPEYVINFFRFVAEELRGIMAKLGYRSIDEMVGQSQHLRKQAAISHWKAQGLDLGRVLAKPAAGPEVGIRRLKAQDHGLVQALDHELLRRAAPALERGEKVAFDLAIRNVNRTVGTMLSSEVTRRYGERGLPDDTIVIKAHGSAGQSFCAFGVRGLTVHLRGDANDYFCKGLSGARVTIAPPPGATFKAEENIIVGNVALYGATSGELYVRGIAGERFAVRNSGAVAVVEGVGDHGCEYMTGGRVVILGKTGRNFAAGMSGGIAYVLDESGDFFAHQCNTEMVELVELDDFAEINFVRRLIKRHFVATGSTVAERILSHTDDMLGRFVKVIPTDYKHALQRMELDQHEPALLAVGGE
jgi:glutamate synthase domain-containing protein 2/glutamate synthase domain-containing protein 3/glutamate synthase domain-containing protein 1